MRVLVTGANGFIGSALCPALATAGYEVCRAVRQGTGGLQKDSVEVGGIHGDTEWQAALDGVGVVVHLAGFAHRQAPSVELLRKVNVLGTERLARQAAALGVKRLLYLSSIKVNGEETERPFTEADDPNPEDAYGKSKLEAERVLQGVAAETGLEVTIIRPPLVYGPEVKGNLLRLLSWIDRGLPSPVPTTENRRTLVGVDNLVELLLSCLEHPRAAGEVFLAGDDEDISTRRLVHLLAALLGRRERVIALPPAAVRPLARLTGQQEFVRRLFGSLQVDSNKARRLLGWRPKLTVEKGLEQMVGWYRSTPAQHNTG